jgi:hypothetical protein
VRRSTLLMSLLLSSAVLACAQGYDLSKLVVHTRYVLVTTNAGYDLTSPNMFRTWAGGNCVQNAIKWGRYALAYQPKDADDSTSSEGPRAKRNHS